MSKNPPSVASWDLPAAPWGLCGSPAGQPSWPPAHHAAVSARGAQPAGSGCVSLPPRGCSLSAAPAPLSVSGSPSGCLWNREDVCYSVMVIKRHGCMYMYLAFKWLISFQQYCAYSDQWWLQHCTIVHFLVCWLLLPNNSGHWWGGTLNTSVQSQGLLARLQSHLFVRLFVSSEHRLRERPTFIASYCYCKKKLKDYSAKWCSCPTIKYGFHLNLCQISYSGLYISCICIHSIRYHLSIIIDDTHDDT